MPTKRKIIDINDNTNKKVSVEKTIVEKQILELQFAVAKGHMQAYKALQFLNQFSGKN